MPVQPIDKLAVFYSSRPSRSLAYALSRKTGELTAANGHFVMAPAVKQLLISICHRESLAQLNKHNVAALPADSVPHSFSILQTALAPPSSSPIAMLQSVRRFAGEPEIESLPACSNPDSMPYCPFQSPHLRHDPITFAMDEARAQNRRVSAAAMPADRVLGSAGRESIPGGQGRARNGEGARGGGGPG